MTGIFSGIRPVDRLPPHAVPVLIGDFPRPNSIQLKAFFAALACTAGTELCHIVGLTPEAVHILTSAEPFENRSRPLRSVTVDMDASMKAFQRPRA